MDAPPGVLLVNLGSPEAPRPGEVRAYLREFLSDPRVLDMPAFPRWLLLNAVILPKRPAESAKAYASIWGQAKRMNGSPLLEHSAALAEAVQKEVAPWPLRLAMRYGRPTIAQALGELQAEGCQEILVLPLYPQYASSSTGTAVQAVYEQAGKMWNTPFLNIVPPFFRHPAFIEACLQVARPELQSFHPDFVVMSFHGLPERHLSKGDPAKRCRFDQDCCAELQAGNAHCYRAQCFETARLLASGLELPPDRWSVAFQSRLGRTPWIRPFFDQEIARLGNQGIQKLAVLEPSFVADCLETLEEVGIRGAESFRQAGGKELRLIPSLNDHPSWVQAVKTLLQESAGHRHS
ncbi:MAG: ferrochelatase [Planctomycetota bacterium]|nr:MAG: ferrochelatase [Planctomycetota bacterium]